MKQFNVGVLGATGMVGQRFVSLLANHPWFRVGAVAASPSSAGKTYGEAVGGRWAMEDPIPAEISAMTVLDASIDRQKIAESVDFVFSAMAMPKNETRQLEDSYAQLECPVISNDSAHRFTPDVPMIIPEINPEHANVIPAFRKRLGVSRGFVAVKSNCSLQSYLPALHPL
ncbi:MAG: aspartate-semialdehyde dehydrogenase, partial [Oscillospiraceae bacterium]|nr:aspartate-semialdehyde dehydrogenase [Oscillospiraceae bacterium]